LRDMRFIFIGWPHEVCDTREKTNEDEEKSDRGHNSTVALVERRHSGRLDIMRYGSQNADAAADAEEGEDVADATSGGASSP
jgi:hypothetical protein